MRAGKILTIAMLLACVFAVGCPRSTPREDAPRPRIISYSPALTEMLFDMGLGDHVVAVTTQCMLPDGEERIAIGDRSNVSVEAILAAEPDVILIQQDPKQFETVLEINDRIEIEHFDIEELADIPAAMERIGRIADEPEIGKREADKFRTRLDAVRKRVEGLPRPRVLFVMMAEQGFFIAGEKSFIKEIIELAGGIDAAGDVRRWAGVNIEHILEMQPDVLICQADPGREDEVMKYWMAIESLPAARNNRVYVVTDRHWTIPSTRTAGIAERAADFIHPETCGEGN